MDDYRVMKVNNKKYNILKNGFIAYSVEQKQTNWVCNCTGFKYRHTCKHIGMVEEAQPKRFPRAIITEAIKDILPRLQSLCPQTEVVGSYRRNSKDSKDIDFLMNCDSETFSKVNSILSEYPEFEPVVSGDSIIRGYIKVASERIEMDINRLSEKMNYALALEFRTGPANHNIKMRALAKSMDGKLNENELVVHGKAVEVNSEEDIYRALGIAYQAPQYRSEYLERRAW